MIRGFYDGKGVTQCKTILHAYVSDSGSSAIALFLGKGNYAVWRQLSFGDGCVGTIFSDAERDETGVVFREYGMVL